MIVGELLEGAAGRPVDAGVANMKNMRGRGFDDDRAQCADIAFVFLVGVLASPGLGMQPGVRRSQHALYRGLYRPGFRSAVVVRQEALDGRLACDLADA